MKKPSMPPEDKRLVDQKQIPEAEKPTETKSPKGWANLWENLVRYGFGEIALRIGTGLGCIILILVVVWVMGKFYLKGNRITFQQSTQASSLPTPTLPVLIPAYGGAATSESIQRLAELHTILPSRPRFDVIQYTVQEGDTVFGIAQKFNLKPESILWGNYNTLADDPHKLKPGQSLNILPVDGTYYEWNSGDGLKGVADYFGVKVEDILNWPGNHLDAATVGDYAKPNIQAGTWLMIPGGHREFITWTGLRITRTDPAAARVYGPGYCGTIPAGVGYVGTGKFIWPTVWHYISGYVFSPETNHYGIDIGGAIGQPLFATDNGVIVYAGWNDHGYGEMVVIDHEHWQSLYAHLDSLNVVCGQNVAQGGVIGWMGITGNTSGPHLHFELYSDTYGRVDPSNFLPPP
jgi:murein DD-endopeptidase MepM/ murein hydrolase activator NlpD